VQCLDKFQFSVKVRSEDVEPNVYEIRTKNTINQDVDQTVESTFVVLFLLRVKFQFPPIEVSKICKFNLNPEL
jgi:hypothetical protein